jgi:hypothetical protein
MKYRNKEVSVFPNPRGSPVQINEQGQQILEAFLNHPEKLTYERSHHTFGKVIEVVVPGKGGARFTIEGKMITFLEP